MSANLKIDGIVYETQTQIRAGVYGYVLTIGFGGHVWTSAWVAVPEATSHEECRTEIRRAVSAMNMAMAG